MDFTGGHTLPCPGYGLLPSGFVRERDATFKLLAFVHSLLVPFPLIPCVVGTTCTLNEPYSYKILHEYFFEENVMAVDQPETAIIFLISASTCSQGKFSTHLLIHTVGYL